MKIEKILIAVLMVFVCSFSAFGIHVVTLSQRLAQGEEILPQEYVYYDAASYTQCYGKIAELSSYGWTCYDCTDSDNDGLYSLYCDRPTPVCDTTDKKCVTTGTYVECNVYQTWNTAAISCPASKPICDNGNCIAQVCTPGSVTCSNGKQRICNSAGTAWGSATNCPLSTQTCVGNQCVNDPCTNIACPDYCSGNTRNYAGSCSNGVCSYSSSYCSDGCSNGKCNEVCGSEVCGNTVCSAACGETEISCPDDCSTPDNSACTTGSTLPCTLNGNAGTYNCVNGQWSTTCIASTGSESFCSANGGICASGIIFFIIAIFAVIGYFILRKK